MALKRSREDEEEGGEFSDEIEADGSLRSPKRARLDAVADQSSLNQASFLEAPSAVDISTGQVSLDAALAQFEPGPQTAAFAEVLNQVKRKYEEQFQTLQVQLNELKVYAQRSELIRMKLTNEIRQLRQDLDDRGIRLSNEIAALNHGMAYASASPQQALSREELRAPKHQTSKIRENARLGNPIITYEERNRRMPKEAGDILKQWLFAHNSNPYPSEEEKRQLAIQCRITLSQIQSWFSNARQRLLRRLDI